MWFERIVHFLNPVLHFKNVWIRKTPKEKWCLFFNFLNFVANMLQFRILNGRENGPLAYSPLIPAIGYHSLIFYTVYYYTKFGRFTDSLCCFCIFGAQVSVMLKK